LPQIDEDTAAGYLPEEDTAKVLAAQFDATYAKVKVGRAAAAAAATAGG
jgi:hypothetical protein